MKKFIPVILSILIAGCSSKPSVTPSSVSSAEEPEETPAAETVSVVWAVRPSMALDAVYPIIPTYFKGLQMGVSAYHDGYPAEWNTQDNDGKYTSNAVLAEINDAYGIINYSGATLYPFNMIFLSEYNGKPNLEYAVALRKHIWSKDPQSETYYVFSDSFTEAEESTEPYGIGGDYPVYVIYNGTFGKMYLGEPDNFEAVTNSCPAKACMFIMTDGKKITGHAVADRNDAILSETTETVVFDSFVNGFYLISTDYTDDLTVYKGDTTENGKFAFVNGMTGERITDFLYEDAWFFEDGYAPVKKDGKWGFIDETGKEVTDFMFEDASPLYRGKAFVSLGSIYGVIDLRETVKQGIPVTSETCNIAPGETPIGKLTVNVSGLNIRAEASSSSVSVGQVKPDGEYPYYEVKEAEDYTWYRIGKDLWIADDGSWLTVEAE